jgi:hypothetical protein
LFVGSGEVDLAEVEPAVGEVGDEASEGGALEEAFGLGFEDVGLGEIGAEEFGVWSAAGEEVAEAGGELEVVERAYRFLKEEKFGGAEDGDGGGAHGDEEVFAGGKLGI